MAQILGQLPGGDPTFLGWLTTVVYLGTAVLCLACALSVKRIFTNGDSRPHMLIWGGLSFVLFFLGLNKELDLQTSFTATIKRLAWEQGLYEYGQRAQVLFLAVFALVGFAVVLVIAWSVRRYWRNYLFLLLGIAAIFRFIVVRIATFYGIFLPELSRFTGGLRINWLLELMGILLIAAAAILNLRFDSRP
ncbi:MAG: hypothetical protein KBE23_23085 [Chloroflexi bacterium]|nr:hypothetical protein [Chloroflexota bacterium]MBP7045656.1 hypothetical protein [Chloroflexota bacterium]